MGVGTEDALELEAIVLQQVGQAAAIELGVARVQQDYVRVVQLIQRQQRRGAHGHIGATQNMAKLHDILYSFFSCCFFAIPKERSDRGNLHYFSVEETDCHSRCTHWLRNDRLFI